MIMLKYASIKTLCGGIGTKKAHQTLTCMCKIKSMLQLCQLSHNNIKCIGGIGATCVDVCGTRMENLLKNHTHSVCPHLVKAFSHQRSQWGFNVDT